MQRASSRAASHNRNGVTWAGCFYVPALIIFALFTYIPFFRAIWLSLHVANNMGEPVRYNGLNYYARILGLDSRTEFLTSIRMSFQFALMVVPFSLILSMGLAMLATARVRGIEIFRTIFTSSIAILLASTWVIWALIYNPSTKATTWLVELLKLDSPTLLASDRTALWAVALVSNPTGKSSAILDMTIQHYQNNRNQYSYPKR